MSYLTRDQLDEYLKGLSLKNSPQRKPSLSAQRLSTSPSRLTVPPNSPNSAAVHVGSQQAAPGSEANAGQPRQALTTTNGSKPVFGEQVVNRVKREQADATTTTTTTTTATATGIVESSTKPPTPLGPRTLVSSPASNSTTTVASTDASSETTDKEDQRTKVGAVKGTPLTELDVIKKNLQSPFKFPAKVGLDAVQRPKPESVATPKPIMGPRPEPKSSVRSKSVSAVIGSVGKPRPSSVVKRQSKADLVKPGSNGIGTDTGISSGRPPSSTGSGSTSASPKPSPKMRPSSVGSSSPKSHGRQRTGSVSSVGSTGSAGGGGGGGGGEDNARTVPTGPYFSSPYVLTVPPSAGPRAGTPGSPKKPTAPTSLNCAGCNEPISGNVLSALGKRWHPHHFVCKHCDVALEHVGFFEREGYPYCHLDFHELFSPRCAYCETPIEGQVINALGKSWHPGHFFCRECGNPFEGGGFMVNDGHAYCQKDWIAKFAPKCKGCNEPITGEHNNALGGMWHRHCFLCAGCKAPFDNAYYYAREQKPYCDECYRGLLAT